MSLRDRGTPEREVLRRLELDVTRRLDGMLHGNYQGLLPGHGSEPGETREYSPGDDVRRIDWNVTARLQSTHIRESIADRELETRVLLDLSPSLDFGTVQWEKRELALALTSALGFITGRVGNRFGILALHGDGALELPAKGGRPHLMSVLHQVHGLDRGAAGTVSLAEGISRLASTAKRSGLVVVISDFLSRDRWDDSLKRLALRHDVVAIEVADPRELELPNVGLIDLIDPESGRTLEIQTSNSEVRTRFAALATAQRAEHEAAIRNAGADHLFLRTDDDWLLELAKFIGLRKRRRGAHPAVGATK